MDGRTALAHAIVSIPVPGAPPALPDDGAAVGLSFLDSVLRLNHVRRLTERLTVSDHRVARRVTEVDVSLRLLDARQRRACAECHELRGADVDEVPGELWVPVARIARSAAAPVDVRDASGARLPRLTEHESAGLVASGLFRLLRGILETQPDATADTDLDLLLHHAHEAEWLIQVALETLLTERRLPRPTTRPQAPEGTVDGQGARYRALALRVLEKHAGVLEDYFELFDITRDNELLVVCLDGSVDEHLLTWETPLHVDPDVSPRRRLGRLLGSGAAGYRLEYGSHLPPGIPGYHLVVETEPGVAIDRMYLSTDADAPMVAALHHDLAVLAPRLAQQRSAPGGKGPEKILELQMQTTLRRLADLVRRRRWECAQAGFPDPDERMLACTTLARMAVAGEGVVAADGTVDSSILLHPLLTPALLEQAGHELYAEEMFADLTLRNDPAAGRAHVYWRGGAGQDAGGTPVAVRSAMLLTDVSTTGPRSVTVYALGVAAAGYLLAAVLAESLWPFGPAGAAALGTVPQADAVVAVLLLVPGFLYTRLALPDRDTVSGHLRALPRLVASTCIAAVALVAATIAATLPGGWVQLAFAVMIVVPVLGAALLLVRRRRMPPAAELVRLGAPRWLSPTHVDRSRSDVRFFSPLSGTGGSGNGAGGDRTWPTAPRATTRALADLARAGHRVLDEPSMQVEFEVHHGLDHPGDLAATLAARPEGTGFADTLCSAAHGASVIVGTRVGDARVPPGERRPRLEIVDPGAGRTVFRGSERPNLTFRHETAELLRGIIVIEAEPKKMLLRHGLAVLDALRHVAETAVGTGDAPLITLQCPAQLPPTNVLHDEIGGAPPEPARASAMAIRFEMALDHPRADVRFGVADRLARYCAERGLGLWLGDTRPGYRAGNWFSVVSHDHSLARRCFPRAADRGAHTAAEGLVPVTLVGPARPGSTHAILSFLAQYPEIGVLGCAMTPLNELAFLHLQLAVNAASRPRLAAVNRALADLRTSHAGPHEVLRTLVPHLVGAEPSAEPGLDLTERLVGRAGDYRVAVGPAVRVVADNVVRRVPVWVSWHVRHGSGPRLALMALQRAIGRLDLVDADVPGPAGAASVAFAVARQLGSTAAGRAKIAVSKNLVERRFAGAPSSSARLCSQLHDAWLDELVTAGHEARPSEVAVSPHEAWLGRHRV